MSSVRPKNDWDGGKCVCGACLGGKRWVENDDGSAEWSGDEVRVTVVVVWGNVEFSESTLLVNLLS